MTPQTWLALFGAWMIGALCGGAGVLWFMGVL